ncbi:MAG: flagellar basal body rod protein FlgB [Rhodovulum sulfidophilum]|uniref:Flagellar basal body rod protein FlgB n=1 Tax=Rhodovulum sulfidophilum TaxID=35806 RepID=A0A2W5QLG5_RHOSU|nr:MAG: flagellar basal body rod protein FlgB [Rhodovulum sulfidophilum]
MDLNLNVLRLASGLATYAARRQALIAENVANADTPGFRARDLPDFAAVLDQAAPPFTARTTRAGHIPFGAEAGLGAEPRPDAVEGADTPNGNSVSIEDQMTRAAGIRQSHDLAMGVYAKTLDVLRASIGVK